MSFILDALKKLEREKQARDPGVVMVAPVPWGERDRRRGPGLAVTGVVLAVALGVAFLWLRSGPESPTAGGEDEGRAAPSEETAILAPEPGGPAAAEPPASPRARTSGPGAGATEPTAPPPRDRPRQGDTTPLVAREALPATPVEPQTIETESAAPEPADLLGMDEGEPDIALAEAPPETHLEEAPPTPAAPPEAKYRLTAISSRDGHPIALLNDRLVREGDSFDGIKVLHIGETSVEIEVNGKQKTISF